MFKSEFSGRSSERYEQPVTVGTYVDVVFPRRVQRNELDELVVLDEGGFGRQLKHTRKVLASEVEECLRRWTDYEIVDR